MKVFHALSIVVLHFLAVVGSTPVAEESIEAPSPVAQAGGWICRDIACPDGPGNCGCVPFPTKPLPLPTPFPKPCPPQKIWCPKGRPFMYDFELRKCACSRICEELLCPTGGYAQYDAKRQICRCPSRLARPPVQ